MIKPMKLVSAVLVPLAVAGTCMAAPVAMAAAPTAAPAPAATAQAAQEQVIVKGHLQVTVPADFVVDESDSFCILASSPDGTMVAYLADVDIDSEMPTAQADLQTTFDEISKTAVEQNGGTLQEGFVGTLTDGTTVYVYLYTVEIGGVEYGTYLVYLPYETGFSFAQLAAPSDISGDAYTVFETMVNSLLPAQKASIEAPEGYVACEADGLAFIVPEDLVDYGDGTWISEGADLMIGSMGVLTDDASTLTEADFDQIVELMGSELGEVQQTATIEANGVSFKALGFSYTDEDGNVFSGIVGFVPNADDELVGLLCLAQDGGTYAKASTAAESFFTSVTVL